MTNCFEAIKDFSAFSQILKYVFLHVLTLFQFVGPGQALTASEGQLPLQGQASRLTDDQEYVCNLCMCCC
jgi:hypothetical protein